MMFRVETMRHVSPSRASLAILVLTLLAAGPAAAQGVRSVEQGERFVYEVEGGAGPQRIVVDPRPVVRDIRRARRTSRPGRSRRAVLATRTVSSSEDIRGAALRNPPMPVPRPAQISPRAKAARFSTILNAETAGKPARRGHRKVRIIPLYKIPPAQGGPAR